MHDAMPYPRPSGIALEGKEDLSLERAYTHPDACDVLARSSFTANVLKT